jgi:Fe-S cluster assembly protein SufD
MRIDLKKIKSQYLLSSDEELDFYWTGAKGSKFKASTDFIFAAPGLSPRITIKAVLFDEASFDLEACVKIKKGQINTATYLNIRVLQAGQDTHVRIVPSLEIGDDQVNAGHGAVISGIDPEQLLYLASRGIKKEEALKLIIDGFLNS